MKDLGNTACVASIRQPKLCDMALTDSGDTVTAQTDDAVRLRVDVYDALAAAKGYTSITAQARWHGVDRSTMHALRRGENIPRLDTAMRIAADLGVRVEVLWERVA